MCVAYKLPLLQFNWLAAMGYGACVAAVVIAYTVLFGIVETLTQEGGQQNAGLDHPLLAAKKNFRCPTQSEAQHCPPESGEWRHKEIRNETYYLTWFYCRTLAVYQRHKI